MTASYPSSTLYDLPYPSHLFRWRDRGTRATGRNMMEMMNVKEGRKKCTGRKKEAIGRVAQLIFVTDKNGKWKKQKQTGKPLCLACCLACCCLALWLSKTRQIQDNRKTVNLRSSGPIFFYLPTYRPQWHPPLSYLLLPQPCTLLPTRKWTLCCGSRGA